MSPRPDARHVYVHVPFCARRCSYCDFAIAVRREVPVAPFVAAIAAEIAIRDLAGGPPLDTLYLGGGTPSRLGGAGVATLIQTLVARFPLAKGAEVTVEANPEDVTPEAAAAWAAAGVNRVSLGVQSFDGRVLEWMHRSHGADAAAAAVALLRAADIPNLSLDLIYAVPAVLRRDWNRDVALALALDPDHLSCYGLTVEPATPLGRWVSRGATVPLDEEGYEADFLATHAALTAAGYEHYEVSNYAKPDQHSRHNSCYWRGVPWIGLGPSAHEFDGRARRWNVRDYAAWQRAVAAGADPIEDSEVLTAEQTAIEEVYLGLRTSAGLTMRAGDESMVDRWVQQGWARRLQGTVTLTPMGWLRLDALCAALTGHRSRY